MNHTIGFIGGGNMAASLIGGLIKNGTVSGKQVSVFEPNADKAKELSDNFGIFAAENNEELIARSNVVVIAVKPQVLERVLTPLKAALSSKQPLIVSVVAGITSESIQKWLGGDFAVVRVMPNTPALIGQGASGLFANQHVSDDQRKLASTLLNAVGLSTWVSSDADIDSVTALSGSGPAYFMLFIQSLIEAGVKSGLDHSAAKQLALQTATGTAAMIEASDLPIQTLIDNVTSPNGTTEQALKSFNNDGLASIVEKAFNAAKLRSEELAAELG